MKKVSKLFILIITIVFIVAPLIVNATEDPNVVVDADMLLNFETTEEGIMPLSEDSQIAESLIVKNDVFKIDSQTSISEIVYGDVYIISDYVDISSPQIEGNIFIIANNVKISGNVNGYLYVISQKLEISGVVQGAYLMSNNVNITENGIIRNDVKVITNTFNLNGTIYRNAQISSENINITPNVENAYNIFGSLSYIGNLNSDENLIGGEITKHETPEVEEQENNPLVIKSPTSK